MLEIWVNIQTQSFQSFLQSDGFLSCWIGFFRSFRGKSLVSVVYFFVNLMPHGFAFCGWKQIKAPSWFSKWISSFFAWEKTSTHKVFFFKWIFHPLLSSSVGGLTSVKRFDLHPSSTGSGEDGDNLTAEDEAGGGLRCKPWKRKPGKRMEIWIMIYDSDVSG